VTRLREQIEGRSAGAVGAVDEVVVADHFSEGVGGGADAGGQEYEVALRCDDPGLRGEIGVGAEDAELGEGRRLGGEEGDLDAVPLACGGGGGGPVRAVGDVAPNAEKDTVGVGGTDVGQGRRTALGRMRRRRTAGRLGRMRRRRIGGPIGCAAADYSFSGL